MTDHIPLRYIAITVRQTISTRTGYDAMASYEIQISGALDRRWSQWFNGVQINAVFQENLLPITTIRCACVDQTKLRGILNTIWDLNLELIAVRRLPDGVQVEDGSAASQAGKQHVDGG
jgi:hypothetical protein